VDRNAPRESDRFGSHYNGGTLSRSQPLVASGPPPAGHTVLRADRVFDARGGPAIDDGAVVIEDGAVVAVGPVARMEPADLERAERFEGCTLLPGLIDAHAHLTLPGDGRAYEQVFLDPDELMTLTAVRNMRRHLESGVTTIRDNGARNRTTFVLREAMNLGYFEGPRLLLSGRAVTHSHGHFHFCNEVADGAEELRRSVRRLVAEGADHIKIMASGGDTAGNQPFRASYTAEELRAAVETAHQLGRLTTAHCRAREAMENAVAAGLDCIEHAEYLVPPPGNHLGTGRVPPPASEYDPALTERMLAQGMFVSFTYQTDGYDTLVELRSRKGRLTEREAEDAVRLEQLYEWKSSIFGALLRDGYLPRLVVSSDAGPADAQFGRFHYNLDLALVGGMTPAQALESVTRVAAEACGIGDVAGTLEAGKRADVIAVRGNPLDSIAAMANVAAVWRDGRRLV
jgi:imidazolonepropionase-like amidohydrolase